MESLDHFTFECIVTSLCTHCGPHPPLHEYSCLGPHRNASCRPREAEAADYVRTLAALCLTSRYVNSVATRHLYHRPTCKRWWALARTLLERPDLAGHVRRLRHRNWYATESSISWGSLSGVVELHLRKQGRRLDDVRSGVGSGLPIFMSICPGLTELDIEAMTGYNGANMFTGCGPGSLKNLKSVSVSPWYLANNYIGLDVACLAPLRTAAPNLERLAGWQLEESEERGKLPLANIKHLQLLDCTITLDYLHTLLAECPRLESFEYRSAFNIQDEDIQVTPVGAQEALAKHAPGLKSLRLNFNDLDFEDSPSDEGWLVTSLTGLPRLESLQVSKRYLLYTVRGRCSRDFSWTRAV